MEERGPLKETDQRVLRTRTTPGLRRAGRLAMPRHGMIVSRPTRTAPARDSAHAGTGLSPRVTFDPITLGAIDIIEARLPVVRPPCDRRGDQPRQGPALLGWRNACRMVEGRKRPAVPEKTGTEIDQPTRSRTC